MPENVKLKDLYGDEKTYNGITAVEIPKASGAGNATFIEPPTSQFMLRETTYQEDYVQYSGTTIATSGISADSMTVISIRNSPLHIDKSKIVGIANQGALFPVFHSLESMSITEFMTRILQEEENEEIVVVPDTYSVSPGWMSIKYSTTKEGNTRRVSIESFSPIDDPSSVLFVSQMPWNIMSGKENYFYSYITEATQQVKSVEITKNGDFTVIPDLGKSGITELRLGVNVPSGSADGGVSFIDYDGTVVETWSLSDLASKTKLPTPPVHDRLVFQQWNWTLDDIKSANAEMAVGALYTTASGLTEFHIRVTKATGLAITCNMVGNKNWGDGTESALTSHTYADYGDYIIICDGNTIAENVMGTTTKVTNTLFRVSISDSVTSIGKNAFSDCHTLQSVSISDSVTSIGNNAFSYCYSLQSISIPDSVTSIMNSTFNACYSLQSISIPDSVTSIGISAFYYCHSLQSVSISDGVTRIMNSTFNSCYSLQSVSIPDSVTSIMDGAFSRCYALQSVSIPDSVTSIGSNAFDSCYALQSISIPDSVTSIGNNAFYYCYVYEYDFSQFSKVPTLGTTAFNGILSSARILVPSALYDTWVAATNWAKYANYIVAV